MAKKTDDTTEQAQAASPDLAAENAALREQLDAKDALQSQILDHLADMQSEIETLKANQGTAGPAKDDDEAARRQRELDAEWDALREEFKDIPNIDIIEQRVLEGNEANNDIRLLDEPGILDDPKGESRKWKLRWFNFGIEGRSHRATQEGYVKVRWDELRDAESIAALDRRDEFVRIGEHGKEVLHKIPLKVFHYKKKRDAARMQGLLTSEHGLRDHLANNVARMAGSSGDNADQAGSLVHGKNFTVSIKPGKKETVTI